MRKDKEYVSWNAWNDIQKLDSDQYTCLERTLAFAENCQSVLFSDVLDDLIKMKMKFYQTIGTNQQTISLSLYLVVFDDIRGQYECTKDFIKNLLSSVIDEDNSIQNYITDLKFIEKNFLELLTFIYKYNECNQDLINKNMANINNWNMIKEESNAMYNMFQDILKFLQIVDGAQMAEINEEKLEEMRNCVRDIESGLLSYVRHGEKMSNQSENWTEDRIRVLEKFYKLHYSEKELWHSLELLSPLMVVICNNAIKEDEFIIEKEEEEFARRDEAILHNKKMENETDTKEELSEEELSEEELSEEELSEEELSEEELSEEELSEEELSEEELSEEELSEEELSEEELSEEELSEEELSEEELSEEELSEEELLEEKVSEELSTNYKEVSAADYLKLCECEKNSCLECKNVLKI
ncbi:protein PF3D7_1417600-like [Hydra vulgaris]|uniref:Protein PF3D7_1417600-like n=1 Tax=Hydra vulgaris TaxID=6087 RepID=A0ABM4DMG7_HYDVU